MQPRPLDFVIDEAFENRFWNRVNRTPLGCWTWNRSTNSGGYGKMEVAGRTVFAHRISAKLTLPDFSHELCVCHTCDNPPCVRPSHLFMGTYQDNRMDASRKGKQRGDTHWKARLTESAVREIRSLYATGSKQTELAVRFNVTQTNISNVVLRKSWAYLMETK